MIIAVDFDGTLVEDKFPSIGKLKRSRAGGDGTFLEELIRLQQAGDKVILYTCREGEFLKEAVEFCKAHGLIFDAVNENVSSTLKWWNGKVSRKPFAHVYVDDRAVNLMGYHKDVSSFIEELTEEY